MGGIVRKCVQCRIWNKKDLLHVRFFDKVNEIFSHSFCFLGLNTVHNNSNRLILVIVPNDIPRNFRKLIQFTKSTPCGLLDIKNSLFSI